MFDDGAKSELEMQFDGFSHYWIPGFNLTLVA